LERQPPGSIDGYQKNFWVKKKKKQDNQRNRTLNTDQPAEGGPSCRRGNKSIDRINGGNASGGKKILSGRKNKDYRPMPTSGKGPGGRYSCWSYEDHWGNPRSSGDRRRPPMKGEAKEEECASRSPHKLCTEQGRKLSQLGR